MRASVTSEIRLFIPSLYRQIISGGVIPQFLLMNSRIRQSRHGRVQKFFGCLDHTSRPEAQTFSGIPARNKSGAAASQEMAETPELSRRVLQILFRSREISNVPQLLQ